MRILIGGYLDTLGAGQMGIWTEGDLDSWTFCCIFISNTDTESSQTKIPFITM